MASTSWMNPHPDVSMGLIEGSMYKVIKTDAGWQAHVVEGKDAHNVPIGEVQKDKLAAQLVAMQHSKGI